MKSFFIVIVFLGVFGFTIYSQEISEETAANVFKHGGVQCRSFNIAGTCFAADTQESPSMSQSLRINIETLLQQAKAAKTAPENLNERLLTLEGWAQAMVQRRFDIDSVLPRERSIQLNDLARVNPEEASKLMEAILKDLGKFISLHPEYAQVTAVPPPMPPLDNKNAIRDDLSQSEIDKARAEVKASPTNSSNIKLRAMALKSWVKLISQKSKDVNKIYSNEIDMFINSFQKENPEKVYGLTDKTFADLERYAASGYKLSNVNPAKDREEPVKYTTVSLAVNAKEAVVSDAVARVKSGLEVQNYHEVFKTKTVSTQNGLLSIAVSTLPLIVEPVAEATGRCEASWNSPFGIIDVEDGVDKVNSDFYAGKSIKDVGYKWIRFLGPPSVQYMIYKNGAPNFKPGDAYLEHLKALYDHTLAQGAMILLTINPSSGKEMPPQRVGTFSQNDIQGYTEFIQSVFRKFPQVKHFTMDTEVDVAWKPYDYALALATTKKIMNEHCRNCKLYTGGYVNISGNFFDEVFFSLKKMNAANSFDAFGLWHTFDLHLGVKRGDIDKFEMMKTQYKRTTTLLNNYGYTNMPVFLGETSTPSGTHNPFTEGYSELRQATELVKIYTTALGLGAFRVFWSNIKDYNLYGGGYSSFDYTALIHNPQNDGLSHKKLSYYSYKNLAEKFRCFEGARASEVSIGKGITAYKFEKDKRTIFVLWAN
ncbi:MAG: hypothetical protein H7844_13210 [Nitrospirae bacterium YQR-1]